MKKRIISLFVTLTITLFTLSGCSITIPLFKTTFSLESSSSTPSEKTPSVSSDFVVSSETPSAVSSKEEILGEEISVSSEISKKGSIFGSTEVFSKSSGDNNTLDSNTADYDSEIYKLTKTGYTKYSYNLLDSRLKAGYDAIAECVLSYGESAFLKSIEVKELEKLLRNIEADHPLFSWLGTKYSYQKLSNGRLSVSFTYRLTKDEVLATLKSVTEKATLFLKNISLDLSEFDRALIVHDKLVSSVVYDLSAPRRDYVSGVLLDARATCEGYAKAYQYLMCRLSIDTIMAYGDAGGPHAWNVISLDGKYYQVDTTFNDTKRDDESDDTMSAITHDYLFLDDTSMAKKHIASTEYYAPPLPPCVNTDKSYFKMKSLVATSAATPDLIEVFSRAVDIALAENSILIEIQLLPDIATTVSSSFSSGELDSAVSTLCKERGFGKITGRTYNDEQLILSYYR